MTTVVYRVTLRDIDPPDAVPDTSTIEELLDDGLVDIDKTVIVDDITPNEDRAEWPS